MLEKMRKRSSSLIIWFFFSIIILAFIISFGPGSFNRAHFGKDSVGSVNGESVPKSRFNLVFENEYERRKQYDKNFTDEKVAQLQRDVFDKLATQILWEQEAEARGIDVSDKVLAEVVKSNPIFLEDGKFSPQRYERYIAYLQTTVSQYEKDLRREIAASILRNTLQDSAFMSKEEAWEIYAIDNTKVNIEYIEISADKAETMGFSYTPTEQEVKDFIAKSADRIQNYYNENKMQYEKPKRVVVNKVVVKAQEGEVVKIARDRAEKIAAEAKSKGLEAAAEAIKPSVFSKDVEIAEGSGDMLEEKVMNAKKGDIIGPVADKKNNDTFVIVQVVEIKPAEKQPLDDKLKSEIAKDMLIKDAKEEFLKTKAMEYLAQLKDGRTINEIVPYKDADGNTIKQDPATGIKSGLTSPFSRNMAGYVRGIGIAKEIMNAAFNLTPDNPYAGPFVVDSDVYLIRFVERQDPDKEKFEKDLETIIRSYQWQHRITHVDEFEKWMKSKADISSDF